MAALILFTMIAFGFLGAAGLLSTSIEPAAAAASCSVDGVDSATSLVPAALLKNLVAANRSCATASHRVSGHLC